MENSRKRFLSAASVLPHNLFCIMSTVPQKITNEAHEIILRSNRPLSIECSDKRYYFTMNKCVTDTILDQQMVLVNQRELFETFQNICNFSVYSRQNEINNGYISIKGGHRAGVCGTAVISDGKIINIKDITSINIRIAKEIIGCANGILSQVDIMKGILVCGAPCSGKTTIIRDIARQLSYKYKVCVIDERNEISSNVNGNFQNDIGLCDVYDSYIKSDAVIQAVRTMSPQVIVCDEVSRESDLESLTYGLNCGVAFVATIHADSIKDIRSRYIAEKLISSGAFEYLVFLDSRKNAGKIKSVVKVSELLGGCDD